MKDIIVFVALFLLSLGTQATGDCRGVVPFNASLLKQFGLDFEFACVYESPGIIDKAVLSFYSKEKAGNKLISSNSILLNLDDIKSGVWAFPASSNLKPVCIRFYGTILMGWTLLS